MRQIITKSVRETLGVAEKIAKNLKGGDILALVGNLGGGKTTFTKGLAKAFGIDEKDVQSPTFTLVKEYKVCQGCHPWQIQDKEIKKIYHLDMYRIENEKEAEDLGLEELFAQKNAIFVIEWADRIKNLLPEWTKWIEFDFMDEKTRKIKIK